MHNQFRKVCHIFLLCAITHVFGKFASHGIPENGEVDISQSASGPLIDRMTSRHLKQISETNSLDDPDAKAMDELNQEALAKITQILSGGDAGKTGSSSPYVADRYRKKRSNSRDRADQWNREQRNRYHQRAYHGQSHFSSEESLGFQNRGFRDQQGGWSRSHEYDGTGGGMGTGQRGGGHHHRHNPDNIDNGNNGGTNPNNNNNRGQSPINGGAGGGVSGGTTSNTNNPDENVVVNSFRRP